MLARFKALKNLLYLVIKLGEWYINKYYLHLKKVIKKTNHSCDSTSARFEQGKNNYKIAPIFHLL
jgi:hypothetical protein